MSLNPDVDLTKTALTDNVNTIHSLTLGELAVLALDYPYAGTPPPDWYETVISQLKDMQASAEQWEDSVGPDLFSVLPQGVLDIGDFMLPAITDMQKVFNAAKQNANSAPTADQINTLNEITGAIIERCQTYKTNLEDGDSKLRDFISQFQEDRTSLSNVVQEAQQQLQADETQLQQINAQISALQVKIARLSEKASNEEIGASTAAFGVVVSLVTIAATGGLGSIISIAVGIAQIAYNTITDIMNSEEIQKDLAALNTLMVEASDETFQVASMQALTQSIDTVLYQNMNYQDAYPTITALVEGFEAQTQTIIIALQQPAVDITKIPAFSTLSDASTNWQTLVDFATKAEDTSLSNSQVQLKLGSTTN